ncbi:MAG: hypothetical protein ACREJU_19380 [Nitrospiraceae bacterium]
MPLIWCSISAHGFGHAAQVVPVLNELNRRVSDLKVTLRTQVPARFFEGRLHARWELSPAEQDIGCVQHGPLEIDVKATWEAHRRFHREWQIRLAEEKRAMQLQGPDLVVSDISYLSIEAGARARIPCAGLCSLSWDRVLEPFLDPAQSAQAQILDEIMRSYHKAELVIRPAPGLPLSAFREIRDVGPIADPLPKDRARVRFLVGALDNERIVLIGFGGIALQSLPFERLAAMTGYRFIVSGPVPDAYARVVSEASLPVPFRALLSSADLLMTKPGYSTMTEAVASQIPVVYVRRYNFADESSLVAYTHRYGRAVELSAEEFAAGRWEQALKTADVCPQPREAAPPPTGAAEAAAILIDYL